MMYWFSLFLTVSSEKVFALLPERKFLLLFPCYPFITFTDRRIGESTWLLNPDFSFLYPTETSGA